MLRIRIGLSPHGLEEGLLGVIVVNDQFDLSASFFLTCQETTINIVLSLRKKLRYNNKCYKTVW